jgi:outer membrane protein OmpA-like peptidoglycan-associated protein
MIYFFGDSMKNQQQIVFGTAILLAFMQTVNADEINFGKQTPTINQVIEAFDTDSSNQEQNNINRNGKARSIDMSSLESTPQANKKKIAKTIKQELIKASSDVALSLEILFDYNSSDLTSAARAQLKPVGEAIASEKLKNLGFVVEGHTDAVGGEAFNISLSEQRADAVKLFLIDSFHISPSRIQIVGKGKNDLFDPKNPDSEINRRVRIVAQK